jgi:hypothetical protein
MKLHIDIVIFDTERYLVFGMETVLTQHFILKGWSVRFLSDRRWASATLMIHSR